MKYLLIILLIISGCTEKKKRKVIPPIQKAPIEVSYDKGLDLMLVDTSFIGVQQNTAAEVYHYQAIYWDSNDNIYYNVTNTRLFGYPIIVSNTNFLYTIDEEKQYEPVFDSSLKEIFPDTQASLLYLGSVTPLERVYLDPTNQVYYIKKLTFFDTSFYISYEKGSRITNINPSPVYPIIISNISTSYDYDRQVTNSILVLNTYFTNIDNQILSTTC
ncbi:MAG: hypothetical protein ACRC0X_01430, partial [Brevinema sp.]